MDGRPGGTERNWPERLDCSIISVPTARTKEPLIFKSALGGMFSPKPTTQSGLTTHAITQNQTFRDSLHPSSDGCAGMFLGH